MVASISFSGRECRHADEIFAFPARTEFSVTTAGRARIRGMIYFKMLIKSQLTSKPGHIAAMCTILEMLFGSCGMASF